MTQLLSHLQTLRATLEAFHPAVPAAILVALIWLSQYLVRRFAPNVWEWAANLPFPGGAHKPVLELARKVWQALPSIATGAFLTAFTGSGSITEAVFGAVLGALAPVWHEALKALPAVPYRGGRPPATNPPTHAAIAYNRQDDKTPAESPAARRRSDPPPSGSGL